MAITVTKVQVPEGIQTKFATIALDSSYPTGGYTILPSDVGLSAEILTLSATGGGGGYVYDWTGSKLKMFRQTAATSALIEVANAVDVSAVTAVTVAVRGW